MNQARRIASRILIAFVLLFCANALAQIPAVTANPGNATEKSGEAGAPETIAAGELPRRLLEESLYLQRAAQRNASFAKTNVLEQELEGIRHNVDALGEKMLGKSFDTLPLSGLEALERYLGFLDKKLSQLQDDLQASTGPLSDDAGELAQRRKLWLETRQASEFITPDLLNSIDALNKEFRQVADEASKPLARLLGLTRDASLLQKRVNNNLSVVRERSTVIGRKLWRFDADNLLAAIQNADEQSKGSIQAVVSGYAVQADFMKVYDKASVTRHTLLAIVALLMLPVFLYLSRWAKRTIARDNVLERYRTTLSRPVSAWLLFIIMCQLAVDFDGPWFRLRLLLALAWLPVMRLQPKWVHDNIGRWIYATALFFAFSFLSQLITTLPLEYRVTLLVNGVLLFGMSLWLTYHLLPGKNPQDSRKRRVATALFAATSALVAFAVVANLLGGVQMAALLTDDALNNLYLALFLCAVRELVHAYAYVVFNSGKENIAVRTQHASRLFEVAFALFNLVLALAWLMVTLHSLRVLGPLKDGLYGVSGFRIEFGSISITIGGIVLFCASVFLSFWIAKTIRSVLSEDVLPNMTLPRGVANSVSTMSYYLLLMLGLLVALTAAGFELSQLALVVGALSVGIGFGLNTVINNFVCGLILMIERPIQPGDTVELSGTVGKIRDIGIRATTLATFDGADVLVPNGLLLSEKLTNWTLNNQRRRIEIPIGVSYESAPRTVQSVLLDVANRTAGISREPSPTVLFQGFGESTLDFIVRAWTDDLDQAPTIRSEMALDIHAALQDAGIEIPFPQRDLHIRSLESGGQDPGKVSS